MLCLRQSWAVRLVPLSSSSIICLLNSILKLLWFFMATSFVLSIILGPCQTFLTQSVQSQGFTPWEYKEHTKVKHILLEKYLAAWIPILGKYNQKICYFD